MITWETGGAVQAIVFDAIISAEWNLSSETSDHPLESGAVGSDHSRPNPRTLEVQAHVSDDPIALPGSHTGGALEDRSGPGGALRFTAPLERVEAIHDELDRLRAAGQIVSWVGPRRVLPSCVITSVARTEDAENSRAAIFSIGLKQITIAESEIVATPEPTVTTAARKKARGVQPAEETDGTSAEDKAAENSKSMVRNLADSVFRSFGGG